MPVIALSAARVQVAGQRRPRPGWCYSAKSNASKRSLRRLAACSQSALPRSWKRVRGAAVSDSKRMET
eukprot:1993430-Rhodomonas_salina.3